MSIVCFPLVKNFYCKVDPCGADNSNKTVLEKCNMIGWGTEYNKTTNKTTNFTIPASTEYNDWDQKYCYITFLFGLSTFFFIVFWYIHEIKSKDVTPFKGYYYNY